MEISVVVSTLGRSQELTRLFDSLEKQSVKNIEVIVVDQNLDECVEVAVCQRSWNFPLIHLRAPEQRGANRGRNAGWRKASGRYVVFADDDCWYPPLLFERVEQLFRSGEADIISGRAADKSGRSINGRFKTASQNIERSNVWMTSIEWMIFFRREVIERIGGFDEAIGVGASSPWQAAEGQDIVLRALNAGYRGYFDPSLYGHHPKIRCEIRNEVMRRKTRGYARGMGFILRRHGYGLMSLISWVGRPVIAAIYWGLSGRPPVAVYYREVAFGRLEGWLRTTSIKQFLLGGRRRADQRATNSSYLERNERQNKEVR